MESQLEAMTEPGKERPPTVNECFLHGPFDGGVLADCPKCKKDDEFDEAVGKMNEVSEAPPTLRQMRDILRALSESQIDAGAEECWCADKTPDMATEPLPCENCEANQAISRLTDEVLDRDGKRNKAMEEVIDHVRKVSYQDWPERWRLGIIQSHVPCHESNGRISGPLTIPIQAPGGAKMKPDSLWRFVISMVANSEGKSAGDETVYALGVDLPDAARKIEVFIARRFQEDGITWNTTSAEAVKDHFLG